MKFFYFISVSLFLLSLYACEDKKNKLTQTKAQAQSTSRVDSANMQTLANKTSLADDSIVYKKNIAIIDSVNKNKFYFNTFSANVNISYKTKSSKDNNGLDFTAQVHMLKDSLIWISAGTFGFELFRILIDKNEIRILDKFNKKATITNNKKIKEFIGIPLNLAYLQQIIIGRMIELSQVYQNIKNDGITLSYSTLTDVLRNDVKINIQDKLQLSNLLSVLSAQSDKQATGKIAYTNYENITTKNGIQQISLNRNIEAVSNNNSRQTTIDLEFKNIKIDNELSFAFNTDGYQIIKE